MNLENSSNTTTKTIALDNIKDNLLRLDFYSQSHLDELTKSIQRDGLIEALIVYQVTEHQKLTLLNGHYRIRSLRRLGFVDAQCKILTCDEATAIAHYLASFLQKNTMTPLEEGHIIQELMKKGYPLAQIGNLWGKSTSWACRRVKLLSSLNEDIKKDLNKGKIPPRTAQELARLPQGNDQQRVLALIFQNQLTKDETALLIDRWLLGDEKAHKEIEKEFTQNQSAQKKLYIASPEVALKSAVSQCSKAISNLTAYMANVKNYRSIWPWEEYAYLCEQFEEVATILDVSPSKKGVQR